MCTALHGFCQTTMSSESAIAKFVRPNAGNHDSLMGDPEVAEWTVILVSSGVQAHDNVPVAFIRPANVVAVAVCGTLTPSVSMISLESFILPVRIPHRRKGSTNAPRQYSPKTADACAAPDVASASPWHRDATAELRIASKMVELAEQKQECEAPRPASPHPDLMSPTISASGDAAHPGRPEYSGTRSMRICWHRAARANGSAENSRIIVLARQICPKGGGPGAGYWRRSFGGDKGKGGNLGHFAL